MTNAMFGTISRFWLEVNAHAWRYCPEAVQQRLTAAYATFTRDARDIQCQQSDADFGRGWREGRAVGVQDGWAERDAEAQRELARKNDQIQALMTLVESYRMRQPDDRSEGESRVAREESSAAEPAAAPHPGPPVH